MDLNKLLSKELPVNISDLNMPVLLVKSDLTPDIEKHLKRLFFASIPKLKYLFK